MKEKHKSHGMAAFEKDHWEKKVEDVNYVDMRYSSEMNQAEEYKHSVDALNAYAKKHKAQH